MSRSATEEGRSHNTHWNGRFGIRVWLIPAYFISKSEDGMRATHSLNVRRIGE